MKQIFFKKNFLKKNILRKLLNKRLLTFFFFHKTIFYSKKPFAKSLPKAYIMLCLKPPAQQWPSVVLAIR